MANQFNITGQVAKVYTKAWFDNKRDEEIILHSFQLQNEKRYFRTGTKNPRISEGETISFTFNTDNGEVDMNTLKKETNDGKSSGAGGGGSNNRGNSGGGRSGTASGAAGAGSRDGYWEKKAIDDKAKDERYQTTDIPRMSFSAAQERAVHLVAAALDNDALSLGQKKGDKLDLVLEFVDQVTDRFFLQSMNAPEHIKNIRMVDGAVLDVDGFDNNFDGDDDDWDEG